MAGTRARLPGSAGDEDQWDGDDQPALRPHISHLKGRCPEAAERVDVLQTMNRQPSQGKAPTRCNRIADRALNPRPRSGKSAVRGFGPLLPPARREWRHDLGRPIWPPSTHRTVLACLGRGHYPPSGVTVKVKIACQAGLAPISRPWSPTGTRTTSQTSGGGLLRWAETEMVQDPADRDGVGDVGNDLERTTAAAEPDPFPRP